MTLRLLMRRFISFIRRGSVSNPTATRSASIDPDEIVKQNTAEAFDLFWESKRRAVASYVDEGRWQLYQTVASYVGSLCTANKLDVANTLRVVDLGCGLGHMIHLLASTLPEVNVAATGVDFSATALHHCRALFPAGDFLVRDICDTGFFDQCFDLVLCLETLEHVQDPSRALAEMSRICCQDGHIIITVPDGAKDTWDGHINYWNESDLLSLVSQYRPSTVWRTYPWHDFPVLIAHLKPRTSLELA